MRRAVGTPPGPSSSDRRASSRRARLVILAAPLAVLSIASAAGSVLSPYLLVANPLLLVALSPRAVHLVVAAAAMPLPTFLAVGMLRLMAADPSHYVLGRMHGTAAAAAIERRSVSLGRVAQWLLGMDERKSLLVVGVSPTGKFLFLAGAGRARPILVALADAGGTFVQLMVLYVSGRPLMQALDPSPLVLAIMAALALSLAIGGPAVVARAGCPPLRDGQRVNRPELLWLPGDHHVHTEYSHDGTYTVAQQAEAAARHGLAWMVVTDHGGADHAKVAVGPTHDDIMEVRAALPHLLLFQGLEWNVPGSEHGTVFMAPGHHEVGLLRRFEQQFDGMVRFGELCTERAFAPTALDGLRWLADHVRGRMTDSALFLINHPSRRGLVSPRHLRAWNDLCPQIAVGMEGAPGHQAACTRLEPRGIYDKVSADGSDSGLPPGCYRTFGGFDWMTATVGGVWDALLAEGRRWWITASSDSHAVATGSGATPDGRDFWPGAYTRTVVGAVEPTYGAVMRGIQQGRMWVTHGDLIWSLGALAVGEATAPDPDVEPSGAGFRSGEETTSRSVSVSDSRRPPTAPASARDWLGSTSSLAWFTPTGLRPSKRRKRPSSTRSTCHLVQGRC